METKDDSHFEGLLKDCGVRLNPAEIERAVKFRRLVVDENTRQNLTKLVSPADFFTGHVRDTVELLRSGFLEFPAMDMGSGCGVPGMLSSVMSGGRWILAESEGKKAAFLVAAKEELGLGDVSVFGGRAEDLLRKETVGAIVARAVGPVQRIYSWIRQCSTWNTLVLFKGPGWPAEWDAFQGTPHGKELRILAKHEYLVQGLPGQEDYPKTRVIIQLGRVPRGTKK